MRISEAAQRSGLSIDTIRYYERTGLCPAILRGRDGKRDFSGKDIAWLTLLGSLRETGMPLKEMASFAALYQRSDQTVEARKTMLLAHNARLEARRGALDRCADLLAFKLGQYEEILGETT